MSGRRIYISGPMSGITNFNASAFNNAEAKLREAGWFPINPIALDAASGDTYEDQRLTREWKHPKRTEYLLRDLQIIMSKDEPIDAVYMLRHWEKSDGARIEKATAEALGKDIYFELEGARLPAGLVVLGPRLEMWPHQRKPDRQNAREFISGRGPYREATNNEVMEVLARLPIVPTIPTIITDQSILDEAHKLVHGPRGADYGHPLDDFTRTSDLLNALGFVRNHDHGNKCMVAAAPLTAEDIAVIMICVKLSRETNAHKRDNLVDICGYAETLRMVRDERKRRAQSGWGDGTVGPNHE